MSILEWIGVTLFTLMGISFTVVIYVVIDELITGGEDYNG